MTAWVIVGNTMSSEAEQKTGKSEGSPNVTGTNAPTLTEMNDIEATTEETEETEENLKDGVAAAEQNEDDLALVKDGGAAAEQNEDDLALANKSTEEGEEITSPLNGAGSLITENEAGEDQPQEPRLSTTKEEVLDPSTQQ